MENFIQKIGTTFSFQEIIILCSLSKKKQSLCVTTIQAPTFLNFHSAQGHSVTTIALSGTISSTQVGATHITQATNKQTNNTVEVHRKRDNIGQEALGIAERSHVPLHLNAIFVIFLLKVRFIYRYKDLKDHYLVLRQF